MPGSVSGHDGVAEQRQRDARRDRMPVASRRTAQLLQPRGGMRRGDAFLDTTSADSPGFLADPRSSHHGAGRALTRPRNGSMWTSMRLYSSAKATSCGRTRARKTKIWKSRWTERAGRPSRTGPSRATRSPPTRLAIPRRPRPIGQKPWSPSPPPRLAAICESTERWLVAQGTVTPTDGTAQIRSRRYPSD
jgi:hypothetical protein